ncbi:MAG: hypothetical protein ABSA79_10450 [Candidatus Bathyarchaeia archaeon]|jgi:hypothetical protein
MTTPENKKITIKLTGEKEAVLRTAKRIESLFPLFVAGKLCENDTDNGCHIFITAVVPEEA